MRLHSWPPGGEAGPHKYGVDEQARTFSPWSHIVALLYAQLLHAIGLNNFCDGMRMHLSQLFAIRGATPPGLIPG
jgi:hypothetical protein